MSIMAYHAKTAFLFTSNNINDIVTTGVLFGALHGRVAASISMGPSLSWTQILAATPAMVLWSWCNLFLFNLHNQRHPSAVAEDARNKPWRPIPSGRITPGQTTAVMLCMYPVVLMVALAVGGLGPCLLQAALSLWYNELDGASHPFIKNLLNGLGDACLFAGPLEVVTGRSVFSGRGEAARWLAILAAAITTTVHTQDFRDCEGDKATGRRTVPLVIGDTNARLMAAAGFAIWTAVSCWYWGIGLGICKAGVGVWVAAALLVTNLFRDRSQRGDSFTWKLYALWLLGLFALPPMALQGGL
ncbi:UbiA prenyltransferase family [Chaetomium fimeti]|uniref:UbiA prenyltransferase family n=1 Tax=Chaetomium fimeti TaxID=1854472 RepID=A0AAE0LPR8_9PEZI|nr:UbiA prenyltransferase family [Chaetomium fimeti]